MMEAFPDRSTSPPLNLERPDAVLERSRFLNALGFGRTQAEEASAGEGPESADASPETDEVPLTDATEGQGLPLEAEASPESMPRDFEPLDTLAAGSSESPAEEEVVESFHEESASATVETSSPEEPEDSDACDPDGMALRGDEGGPAFLASGSLPGDDADDWERDLLVGDDDDHEPAHSIGLGAALLKKTTTAEKPVEETRKAGLATFAWMNPVAAMEKEEGERPEESDASPGKQPEAGIEPSSVRGGGGGGTLDFETFSQRLKSVAAWRPPISPGGHDDETTRNPPSEPMIEAEALRDDATEAVSLPEVADSLRESAESREVVGVGEATAPTSEIPVSPDSVKDTAPVGDTGIVDLACPHCGKGLSLRKEHLGIAGQCVWCEAPLVAAASPLEGVVRVFLIKPGSAPVEERRVTPGEQTEIWAAPLAESPPDQIADTSPLETDAETLAEPEESEMVEPEVIGSLDESAPDTLSESPTMPAWQPPVSDAAASMWAERASAVRRSLAGETPGEAGNPEATAPVESGPVEKAADTQSSEPFAGITSPMSGGHPSAFSWMEPKPSLEPAEPEPKVESVAEAGMPSTDEPVEAKDCAPESLAPPAVSPTSSAFAWSPPGQVPGAASSESDSAGAPVAGTGGGDADEATQIGGGFRDPFAGIGAALAKAAAADETPRPLLTDANAAATDEPVDYLSGLLAGADEDDEPKTPAPETSPAAEVSQSFGETEEPVNDPFGASGLLIDSGDEEKSPSPAVLDDPFASFTAAASGSDPVAEPEAPATLNSLFSKVDTAASKPGVSLFDAGKTAPELMVDDVTADSDPVMAEAEKTSGIAAEAAVDSPKEEAPVKPEAKSGKAKKSGKPPKTRRNPVARSGSGGGWAKKLVMLVVVAGLLAGMAVAALFFKQIATVVKTVLQPLLEQIAPAAGETPEVPDAVPSPQTDESTEPLPSEESAPVAAPPAADASALKIPASSAESSASQTPALITIPQKKSLFGGGPLLINDGGGQSDGTDSSE